MQLSHERWKLSVEFDDPNLVSSAGLVPVAGLAERAGLARLLGERLTVPAANAATKVIAVVLGMVAGADSITDLDLLRHGGMRRLFTGVRAPSTLGTLLRAFTFGHVRQLDAVASRPLCGLVSRAPLLAGGDQITYLDVDDTVRETHGYAKRGAGRGYTGLKGLNVLLATLSTPGPEHGSVPVIAASRLRQGPSFSGPTPCPTPRRRRWCSPTRCRTRRTGRRSSRAGRSSSTSARRWSGPWLGRRRG